LTIAGALFLVVIIVPGVMAAPSPAPAATAIAAADTRDVTLPQNSFLPLNILLLEQSDQSPDQGSRGEESQQPTPRSSL
jgi:hypothetical protein